MEQLENRSLRSLNTFGVPAEARYFVRIDKKEELPLLFTEGGGAAGESRPGVPVPALRPPVLVLGGGSNILFTGDYPGTVVKINIKGIGVTTSGDDVYVEAGAGEVWNDLVRFCVDRGYAGIENLSLIPGSVGAAPIQNIGAYGVELKDVFDSLEAFDVQTGLFRRFGRGDCDFGYRDSVFKNRLKGRYVIVSVRLKLSLRYEPNLSYGTISAELERRGITSPGVREVSEAVSAIRVSKLPDPSVVGNAGSFFKNPIVEQPKAKALRKKFPALVSFSMPDGQVKLAAGWLIEECGWKGKKVGHAGTWKNQALVLVNHGEATGKEVLELSEQIILSVKERFGVTLEREVNVV